VAAPELTETTIRYLFATGSLPWRQQVVLRSFNPSLGD
jgi:hypothetical protein